MTKKIALSQGRFAVIDDEDYELISRYRWRFLAKDHKKKLHDGYAAVNLHIPGTGHYGKSKTLLMHRLIVNAQPGQEVDHINGDSLDNRKCNLRICSKSENGKNKKTQTKNKSSRFKGVCKIGSKWMAYIMANRKRLTIGQFENEVDAAKAYNEAAIKLHGEFACLNKI